MVILILLQEAVFFFFFKLEAVAVKQSGRGYCRSLEQPRREKKELWRLFL